MSHFYYVGDDGKAELFDENHRLWGRLPGWPTIKSGAPKKKINDSIRLKLGLYPSVTTINKFIGESEGLIEWAGSIGRQAGIRAAIDPDPDSFARTLYKELKDEASSRGTDFHKAIEVYLTTGEEPVDQAMLRACREVDALGLTGKKEWAGAWEIGGMRYAGTIDHLHDGGVDDFKTVTKKRDPYPHEVAQVAAYLTGTHGRLGIGRNIYILQETGEIYSIVEWTPSQLEWGWEWFCQAYKAWEMSMQWSEVLKGTSE